MKVVVEQASQVVDAPAVHRLRRPGIRVEQFLMSLKPRSVSAAARRRFVVRIWRDSSTCFGSARDVSGFGPRR